MKPFKVETLLIIVIFLLATTSLACNKPDPNCNHDTSLTVTNGNHIETEMNNGINFQPQFGQEQSSTNTLVGGSPVITGGKALAIGGSTRSSAVIGDINTTLEYHEIKQFPIPGDITLPGILQTPNFDAPGPLVYKKSEMLFIKFVYTLQELEDMASGYNPDLKGDLLKKNVLPKDKWSREIAFYLEIPTGYTKNDFKQVGMLTLDSDAKKIPTSALFGSAGLETAKHGGDSVIITGDGYQREDKNFSVGPGASYTGASGNGVATVSIAFVYAVRWKTDYPWIHATAVIAPNKK